MKKFDSSKFLNRLQPESRKVSSSRDANLFRSDTLTMSQSDKQFAIFTNTMYAGPFAFDTLPKQQFEELLKESLKIAGFLSDKPEPAVVAQISVSEKPTLSYKQMTGYNMFMKHHMAVLKEKGEAQSMDAVGKAWSELSEAQKKEWNDKASLTTPIPVVIKPGGAKKGPKSRTGYQQFVSEQMPIVMATKVNGKLPKKAISIIADKWNLLSDDEQNVYVAKAKATGK